MMFLTHPFGFAQGRLFSQSARKGWGTRQVAGKCPFGRAISLGRQTGRSPWNPAPCTKRKERATQLPKIKGKGSGQECPLYTTLGGRAPQPFVFLKGGIPRLSPAWDFLLSPAAPSFIKCTDDPHHPYFSQSARRGWGTPAVLASISPRVS